LVQRQKTEAALSRAEIGEAEAQRQATEAEIQRRRAEEATKQAESNALNAEIRSESLTVENLLASNLDFRALLSALKLGSRINSLTENKNCFNLNSSSSAQTSKTEMPLESSVCLQAISVIREASQTQTRTFTTRNYFKINEVRGVSFSPDGQTIAIVGADGIVQVWDTSGRLLETLEGHSASVLSVSFSPDGQTIAIAGDDGTVEV